MAHHHDDMASMASRAEPSGIRNDRRTPAADSTRYGAAAVPADEYGCQRCSRSKANRRSTSAIAVGLSVDRALRGPPARENLHLHAAAALPAEARWLEGERPVTGGVVGPGPRLAAPSAPRALTRHTRPVLRTSRSGP